MRKFRKSNFFVLIYTCLSSPRKFAKALSRIDDPRLGIYFFIFILCISSAFRITLQTLLSQNPTIFFLGITSLIFSIPLTLVFFFLISSLFFIILKILGYKITFGKTLTLSSYSSAPLIFVQLPFVSYVAWGYLVYILILSFYTFLNKNLVRIALSIIIPFLASLLVMFLFGLI